MNTSKNLKLVIGSILMLFVTTQISVAQTYNLNNNASDLKVEGTSNIHDWELVAENQRGQIVAETENGQIKKISQLDLVVKAESLKSGKSGMDKNTYKALNTDRHKEITFKLNKVNSIDCATSGNCKVSAAGNLTIAGNTKPVEITFDAKVNGDKIELNGNKTIKMTEYKVEPPTAMFGTITTGDQVTIKFKSTFTKSNSI